MGLGIIGSETTETVFCVTTKSINLHTGMRTGFHDVFSVSVCCMLSIVGLRLVASSQVKGHARRRLPQTRHLPKAGEYRLTRAICFVARRFELASAAILFWFWSCVSTYGNTSWVFFFFFFVYLREWRIP